MKLFRIALAIPLAAALALGASALRGDDKTKPSSTPVPFPDYWDAEAWESGSSEAFWRQRGAVAAAVIDGDARPAEACPEAPVAEPAAPCPAGQAPTTRADAPRGQAMHVPLLSHRQTEK